MNITKLTLSALNPQGKGLIESKVKIVKQILKKMLVSQNDYNWECIPYLISRIINTSKSNKTSIAPYEFIYGPDSENSMQPFSSGQIVKLHPLVQSQKSFIDKYRTDLNKIISDTRDHLNDLKIKQNEIANKNRINKQFAKNDIVFCVDNSYVPGSSRPLKSKFSESPWVIMSVYPTTCLIRRLSDSFTQIYSKNLIKKIQ